MFIILGIIHIVTAIVESQPAANQLEMFRETHPVLVGYLTTSAGAQYTVPVSLPEATFTLNTKLILNNYFVDSITHFTRERIPDRMLHIKGAGAFGYFEITNDIINICKAKLFGKIGKKTPVVARFSLLVGEKGSSDTNRGVPGFSIKFYTEEGNFDMVGLNEPIFAIKDPGQFPAYLHSQKKNPTTNLHDADAIWDYMTRPETLHSLLYDFGDHGIPFSYSNMPGYSVHTFQVENDRGDLYFVRFHYEPDSGINFLTSKEAREIGSDDTDYFTRNLYNSIGNGIFPSWTVSFQILTIEDVKIAGANNVFDTTKILPLNKYPLTKVGKLVLNRNPLNYFADIQQLAYVPANFVPGILGAPDTLFQGRLIAYRDTILYRLGANFHKIHVNCPFRTERLTYNRDGVPPVGDNGKDFSTYFPNSFNGPMPYFNTSSTPLIEIKKDDSNNFEQASVLYA